MQKLFADKEDHPGRRNLAISSKTARFSTSLRIEGMEI